MALNTHSSFELLIAFLPTGISLLAILIFLYELYQWRRSRNERNDRNSYDPAQEGIEILDRGVTLENVIRNHLEMYSRLHEELATVHSQEHIIPQHRMIPDQGHRKQQQAMINNILPPPADYDSCKKSVNSKNTECPICLEEFLSEEFCRVLPLCNHIYHFQCIDGWFLRDLTCPVCRGPVVAEL